MRMWYHTFPFWANKFEIALRAENEIKRMNNSELTLEQQEHSRCKPCLGPVSFMPLSLNVHFQFTSILILRC